MSKTSKTIIMQTIAMFCKIMRSHKTFTRNIYCILHDIRNITEKALAIKRGT